MTQEQPIDYRAPIIFTVSMFLASLFEFGLWLIYDIWQLLAVALITLGLTGSAIYTVRLAQNPNPYDAYWFALRAVMLGTILTSLFIGEVGPILGLGLVLIAFATASAVLTISQIRRITTEAIITSIILGAIDLIAPSTQYVFPLLRLYLLLAMGLLVLVFFVQFIRNYRSYRMTVRLTATFMLVSIFPLTLLALLNDANARAILTGNAFINLQKDATSISEDVDNLLLDLQTQVALQSNQPPFTDYLMLETNQPIQEMARERTDGVLRNLMRINPHMKSYALVDMTGRVVASTFEAEVRRSVGQTAVYQGVLENEAPFASPVVAWVGATEWQAIADDHVVQVGSPVYNAEDDMIGVLVANVGMTLFQEQIERYNNVTGQDTYAILIDEQTRILAHGTQPDLQFYTLVNVPFHRLWRVPDLFENLDTMGEEDNNFGFGDINSQQIASASLTNAEIGWSVVMAQPAESLLATLQFQSRRTYLLVILISTFVMWVAFTISQRLSTPILQLNEVVQEFSQGNLTSRAEVVYQDETGELATNFNDMAHQLEQLFQNLEERTYELEAQITERLRAEQSLHQYKNQLEDLVEERTQALRIAKEEAETANRAKSAFLANMSHELRTPLNAIIGYSEMIAEDLTDEEMTEFVPDLEKIQTSGRHLLTLINQVLDLSKVEAGRMELDIEPFNPLLLLNGVMDTMRPLFEKRGNQGYLTYDEGLENATNDVMKLRQILLNLVGNATKFTENGEIRVHAARTLDQQLHITIRDTGIGMSEEQLNNIFQPFTQADSSTTRKYGGTGLGLAISRLFAEMMGGDLIAESEPNVGATFHLIIPLKLEKPQPQVGS